MLQQRIDRAIAQQTVFAQRLAVDDLVRGLGQPQLQTFAQPFACRIDEEALQGMTVRNAGGILRSARRQRLRNKQRLGRLRGRSRHRPFLSIRKPPRLKSACTARIARTERARRKRLQRMLHAQRLAHTVAVHAFDRVQQLGDHRRRFAHAAVARIAAAVAEIEHVARGAQQLQEQEAVVVAHRAVAQAARRAALDGIDDAVDVVGRLAARVGIGIQPQQADHPERHRAQRHHAGEGHAAGQPRTVRRRQRQRIAQCALHQHGGQCAGIRRFVGEIVQRVQQQAPRLGFAVVLRHRCEQRLQHVRQTRAPVGGGVRRAHPCAEFAQFSIQRQGTVEGVRIRAFEFRIRRDVRRAGRDLRGVGARRVTAEQTVDAEIETVFAPAARTGAFACGFVFAPADAHGLEPCIDLCAMHRIELQRVRDGGRGQQIAECAGGQRCIGKRQQIQQHSHQRMRLRLRPVGQRKRNVAGIVGRQAAEHRARQRQVIGDVGRQHRDVARLQRRIEAGVIKQRAQLVVQHLDFAQLRMAGVQLQGDIAAVRQRGGRRRAVQHILLQAVQQRGAAGRQEQLCFALRQHDFIGKQLRQDLAPARAPGGQ